MTEGRAIQGILFDVHDTLIIKDYRAIRQGLLNSVCALQGLGYEVSYEEYEAAWRQAARVARRDPQELGEVTFEEWYDILFTNLGLAGYGRDLMHQVNQAWNQAFASATRALPQTKGVLRRLRPLYRLGIVSTSLAPNTLLDLRVAGILDFFEPIIISSDVGKRKPHPLIFLKALERMGLEPHQAVFVGDNLYEDILGAKGVGMKAVLLTHPLVERARRRRGNAAPDPMPASIEPDSRIRGLGELIPLLETGLIQGGGDLDRELILTGRIVTGLGQGATFTQLPWAREQFVAKLGVDPYPGTLNLKIEDPGHLASLRAIKEREGVCIPPPNADFCAAKGFRVMVADRFPGAIVFPLVPGYPEDTIEIISPVHLKSALAAEDGSVVTVRVCL